jgi:FtsP/CotA-like multicopper oxidase with cupredoxin domain
MSKYRRSSGSAFDMKVTSQRNPLMVVLHQTRFAMNGSNGGVLQDNFALGVAAPDASIADQVSNNQNGVCTIAQWRSGHCVSPAKAFDIPFAELGEFVYHCHILEHEDGGMMARVKVVPASN